ncbi:hypothetical protein ACVWY5_006444 [Bradyrhizobium sp. USDA 3256]
MLDKDFVKVSTEELEKIGLESTRTIEIDEFVDKADPGPRSLIRPLLSASERQGRPRGLRGDPAAKKPAAGARRRSV